MDIPEYRLGDMIEDYCPRCRLLLNHAVASMVDGKVVKVICQTCYSEHPYRHGASGKKKKPSHGRAALFDQVLAKAAPALAASAETSQSASGERDEQKKKKPAAPARYISRRQTKLPRKDG